MNRDKIKKCFSHSTKYLGRVSNNFSFYNLLTKFSVMNRLFYRIAVIPALTKQNLLMEMHHR